MKNKIIYLSIILTFILSVTCFAIQTKESTYIADGVTLEKVTLFDKSGFTYLNIIKIDMTNDDIYIKPLISQTGVSHFATINNMVLTNNALVGINGDYFSRRPNVSKRGQSIGLLGYDKEIYVSCAEENESNDKMASFILTNDNTSIFSYLRDCITITSPKTGNIYYASDINKYLPYNGIGIFTNKWGNLSIGNSEGNELVEVLVEDNIVKEIRKYLEPICIPENGYVLSAYGKEAIEYILNNFNVGDTIEYSIDINLNLDNLKFAISGGTYLVKDGQIPKFSHIVYGTNEMSAIGTNKENDTIYLISSSSITQSNFAKVIQDYGIYNALCLDGGDSTTLAMKNLGTDNIKTIFSHSNVLRTVANGIGVFSNTKENPTTKGLNVTLNDNYIFQNDTTTIDIKAYDTNYNKIDIDKSKIAISFNNDNAKYIDGKIVGMKEGYTQISITYDNITVNKDLQILGDIYSIEISPKYSNTVINKEINYSIIAKDKNGFSKTIQNNLLTWSIDNSNGTIQNGTFLASKFGSYNICATIDNVTTYANVYINSEITEIIDGFEQLNGNFSAYPKDISSGNIKCVSSTKKSGKYSLRLYYDFKNNDSAIRGAYYDYSTPLNVPNDLLNLGVYVYATKKSDNSIKSQYIDKNGKTCVEVLANEIDWTGWKYLQYSNCSKISSLISIYVAQSDLDKQSMGYIYIDDLTAKYLDKSGTNISLPKDIEKTDVDKLYLEDSNCITFIDGIYLPITLFDNLLNTKIIKNINNNSNTLFTYNDIDKTITDKLKLDYNNISNCLTYLVDNTQFIFVNNSNNGIRETDFNQWETISKNIDTDLNLVIVLSNNLDTFSDTNERELLLNILQNRKAKTWIIQNGNYTYATNYNGIKILTIGNLSINETIPDVLENYKYINLYIKNNDLYYDIIDIF